MLVTTKPQAKKKKISHGCHVVILRSTNDCLKNSSINVPLRLGNCVHAHHKPRADEYITFLALKKTSQTAAITGSELHGGSLLNVSRENGSYFKK